MKNHRFNPFRTGLAAATLTLLAAGPLWAGNTWTGLGFGGDNWTFPNNWDGGEVPDYGTAITFAGDTRNTPVNDRPDNSTVNGINFTNDGSTNKTNAFTLTGNSITLGGNIFTTQNTEGSTIEDEISMDMILNGTRTINTAHQNSSVQHNLLISGDISETGGARNLTKAGSAQLTLTGSNSFSGTLGIFGTLNANSIADSTVNSALGTGNTIRIGVSGGTGTLNLTAGAASTNRQIQIGNGADPAHSGGGRINNNTANGAGALVFTNTDFNVLNGTAITGRTLTLGGANTDANEIQGIIADNNTEGGGTIGVTKEGDGRWILSGPNTYTGDTTVNAGTLAVDGDSIADTGKLVIVGGKVDATGSETVATLFFGAEQQAAGTWGSSSSAAVAPFVDDTRFSGSGVVVVTSGPAGGFSSWITGTFANGPVPGDKQGPNDDADGDGISNLVEYAIDGQDPTVANPTIGTFSANVLSFTKRAGTSGLTYAIVESTDLGITDDWTEVSGGGYVNDATTISYTLTPGTPAKNFVRLKVVTTP